MWFVVISLFTVSALASKTNERFSQWMEDFHIRFDNEEHLQHVFSNWIANDEYIMERNAENRSYTLGHNILSGLNADEYRAYLGFDKNRNYKNDRNDRKEKFDEVKCLYGCIKAYDALHKRDTVSCVKNCFNEETTSIKETVNWVESGAVTPVKDQGQCGSCWSFSTSGALEGAYYIKYGTLISFSEQELVDCDNFAGGGRDHGCNGGLMDNAFTWIQKHGGLCTEQDYPYTSGTTKTSGECNPSCDMVDGSQITGFVDVPQNSDDAMMQALSKQPVSIAIQADQRDFQLYKSGIFTGDCGTNLDHGVLAVGYGEDYYLVKNSWSSSWGDGGYIKLGKGSEYNHGAGQCGMLMQGSYPEL